MFEFSAFGWFFSPSYSKVTGPASAGKNPVSENQEIRNCRVKTEGDASVASCPQTIKDIEAILATSHVFRSMDGRRQSGDEAAVARREPGKQRYLT